MLGGELLGAIKSSGGYSLDLVVAGGQGAEGDDKVLADLAGGSDSPTDEFRHVAGLWSGLRMSGKPSGLLVKYEWNPQRALLIRNNARELNALSHSPPAVYLIPIV